VLYLLGILRHETTRAGKGANLSKGRGLKKLDRWAQCIEWIIAKSVEIVLRELSRWDISHHVDLRM
jgi:hypothetical protein